MEPVPDDRSLNGDYIVYVDESGDHGSVSKEFPIFVLAFCVFRKRDYAALVTTALTELKFKWFGHDAHVLHEREIRKQLPPFQFLTRADVRQAFMADVAQLVEEAPFTLIASVIRKDRVSDPADWPTYPTAMQFGMERVAFFLRDHGQRGRRIHVVFERRGKVEDDQLELEFRRILPLLKGDVRFEIVFAPKSANHCGHQIADLIARPIGLSVLRPGQANRALAAIELKYRRSETGRVDGYGLKVFP